MRRSNVSLFAVVAMLAGACVLPDYRSVGAGAGGSGGGGGGTSPACEDPLTRGIGTPNTDELAVDLVVDGQDAFVVGDFKGTIGYVPGTTQTSTDFDVFVARFGPDGTAAWVTQLGGADAQFTSGITRTSDGGLVVVGIFRGDLATETPPIPSSGGYDAFAVRVEADGTVGWTVTFGGPGDDVINDVAATPDGGVLLVGTFTDEILIDGLTLPGTLPDGQTDTFLVKLDASGGFVSKQAFTEMGASSAVAVAVLPTGESLMAGTYTGRLGFVAPETAPDADGADGYVVKLDAQLNPLWSRRYGGPGNQSISNLALVGSGFVIAGVTDGSTEPLDFGGVAASATDPTPSAFVARVSDANVGAWARILSTAEPNVNPEPVVSALASTGKDVVLGMTVKAPLSIATEKVPDATDGSLDPVLLVLDATTGAFSARAGLAAPDDQRIEEIVAGTCGVAFVGWFVTSLTMPDTPKVESTGRNVAVGRLGASLLP